MPRVPALPRPARRLILILSLLALIPVLAPAEPLALENAHARFEVTTGGRNQALIDRSDGTNLLAPGSNTPLCTLQKHGATWESLSLEPRDGLWHVGFGEAGVTVVLRPETYDNYFTLEVVSVSGEGIDQLHFLFLPLGEHSRSGRLACGALALNLQSSVPELPGPMSLPQATCYPGTGFAGAKVALIVVPRESMRQTLQEVMLSSDELPHSPLGGPWALDAEINRGSYLIDTEGEVGEATAGAWIELAGNLGMKQIDLHTGKSMRFGDLRPNPERYPNGRAGVKAVVDRFRAAGLVAGLHTYAFFIAKDTPWVTPIPDRRLAVAARFTLDADIDAAAGAFPVVESTADVSTITGFQIRNSVTLRIDDELIVFSEVNKAAPFGFNQCERGAWGTTPAPHRQGAEVVQLKECFGLFAPDGDSTLFTEVAARTAEVYNECGFEMIYLDALDGSDILRTKDKGWAYYSAKFVFELNARLERPALFEMSTMNHHLWMLRSRMGAWDVPARGARRLVDIHALANESARMNYMPTNLGWSGIFDWNAIQPERTCAADVEHLAARALATDSSLSLLVGFTPTTWERSANVRRLGGIIQRYEHLRLARTLPESTLAQLRASRTPFVAEQEAGGNWQVRPRHQSAHIVAGPDTARWTFHNPCDAQPPEIRIELLGGVEPYHAGAALQITGGRGAAEFDALPAADGVSFQTESGPVSPGSLEPSVSLVATNAGAPVHASWAGVRKRFAPALNLYGRGLGLWVHGDGKGAMLNVQLQATEAAAGGHAEHYVNLDFQGWKYIELVEPESDRLGEFGWPYSRRHADWNGEVPFLDVLRDYILWVDYGQIEHLNLWLNNIPSGESVACLVGPVKALPLRGLALSQPALAVNGTAVALPVDLQSGQYVEIEPSGAGTVYGATGEPLQACRIPTVPPLEAGENAFLFESGTAIPLRARITIGVRGDALGE